MDMIKGKTKTGKVTSLIALTLALMLVLGILLFVGPQTVEAVPPGSDLVSKAQQAAEVSREIEALDKELAIHTESYNRVKEELDQITAKVDRTRKRLREVKKDLKERKEVLNGRVEAMYKKGRMGTLEVLLNTDSLNDFFDRTDYVIRVAEADSKMVSRIKVTKESVKKVEREHSEQQRKQKGLLNQVSAKKTMIETKLTERRQLLDSLDAEIARLLELQWEHMSQQSAEWAREVGEDLGSDPDASIARTALQFLGVLYHYAADGPGTCPSGLHPICFDCSGFTQYIYKQHGISIPHNSMLQYSAAVKVPPSQAKPGDLVFFGMPPHHVGLYLGGGKYIHAPHTGDVVKVSSLANRTNTSGFGRFH